MKKSIFVSIDIGKDYCKQLTDRKIFMKFRHFDIPLDLNFLNIPYYNFDNSYDEKNDYIFRWKSLVSSEVKIIGSTLKKRKREEEELEEVEIARAPPNRNI